MSVDVSAYAVLGVWFDEQELLIKGRTLHNPEHQPACAAAQASSPDARFCPECGKAIYVDTWLGYIEEGTRIHKDPPIHAVRVGGTVYVGVVWDLGWNDTASSFLLANTPLIPRVYDALCEVLSADGLWHEQPEKQDDFFHPSPHPRFGMHVLKDWST